jgi:hypothetical protein
MPPLRPLQWLTYSPVTMLPLLAALMLEGPALQAKVEAGVRASLAEAGAGWAKADVRLRDVRLSGEAPSAEARDAVVAAVRAAPGVRRVSAAKLRAAGP